MTKKYLYEQDIGRELVKYMMEFLKRDPVKGIEQELNNITERAKKLEALKNECAKMIEDNNKKISDLDTKNKSIQEAISNSEILAANLKTMATRPLTNLTK
jgi:hypothetical protein